MSTTAPSQWSRAERLRSRARALAPAQPPFYVQHPDDTTPLVGWWWIPAGASEPVPLGHNYEVALIVIVRLVDGAVVAA